MNHVVVVVSIVTFGARDSPFFPCCFDRIIAFFSTHLNPSFLRVCVMSISPTIWLQGPDSLRCSPPPHDRSITVKSLKSGNFNNNFYYFPMALKTLAMSLYEVWAHGVCFAKLPFNIWIFQKFRPSEKWTTVRIYTHMVVMFKCGNLWHKKYMCQCSRSIH